MLEAAIGLAPVRGVTVSVGAARQERLPPEVSIATSFSPAAPAVLSAGLLTDPARFWAALVVRIDRLDVGYGYAEHPDLPGGHSVALCWGGCRADPAPVDWEEEEPAEETPDFPIDANTATAEQLDLIPGIGPSRAATLVSWIRENGPITSVDELDEVPGIGPSLLAVLRDYLVAE